jgi:hypothetical protein
MNTVGVPKQLGGLASLVPIVHKIISHLDQEGHSMKPASYVISCALSLGLGADSAFADVITVNVAAHVQGIVDNSHVFPGLARGQPLTATYSYDTDTPSATDTPPGQLWLLPANLAVGQRQGLRWPGLVRNEVA